MCLLFLLVVSHENYKVVSTLITELKLPLNNADNFCHSNGALVVITLVCTWVPLDGLHDLLIYSV